MAVARIDELLVLFERNPPALVNFGRVTRGWGSVSGYACTDGFTQTVSFSRIDGWKVHRRKKIFFRNRKYSLLYRPCIGRVKTNGKLDECVIGGRWTLAAISREKWGNPDARLRTATSHKKNYISICFVITEHLTSVLIKIKFLSRWKKKVFPEFLNQKLFSNYNSVLIERVAANSRLHYLYLKNNSSVFFSFL